MWPLAVKSIGIRPRASAREGSHFTLGTLRHVDPRSAILQDILQQEGPRAVTRVLPFHRVLSLYIFFVLIALRNRGELRRGRGIKSALHRQTF